MEGPTALSLHQGLDVELGTSSLFLSGSSEAGAASDFFLSFSFLPWGMIELLLMK